MDFVLVHTADWQIGKAFGTFDAETATLLKDVRLNAIDRIGALARGAGAAHVLVAGDIYDVEVPGTRTLRLPLERMRQSPALTWHLLPGNHDYARDGGIWDRLISIGLPENVVAHVEAGPYEIAQNVWLLPSPLRARATSVDPTAWMDEAATPEGALRIGLAHGSIKDFGETNDAAVKIDPTRVKRAGLDYLALGDWHGVQKISDRCWYSGTPEPDRWPDNDPGHALLVRFNGANGLVDVSIEDTATYTWLKRFMRIEAASDLDILESELVQLGAEPARLLLQLTLEGALSLHERAALNERLSIMDARFRHIELVADALLSRPAQDDLEKLSQLEGLSAVTERLAAMVGDNNKPRAKAAERALLRLYEMVMVGGWDHGR